MGTLRCQGMLLTIVILINNTSNLHKDAIIVVISNPILVIDAKLQVGTISYLGLKLPKDLV